MSFSIESLDKFIKDVDVQLKAQSEAVGDSTKKIEEIANFKEGAVRNTLVLSGALQAYKHVKDEMSKTDGVKPELKVVTEKAEAEEVRA